MHTVEKKQQTTVTPFHTTLGSCTNEIDDNTADTTVPQKQCTSRTQKHKKAGTEVFITHDILSRPNVVSLATLLKMTLMQIAAFTRAIITESGGDPSAVSLSYVTADQSRCRVLDALSKEVHERWKPPPACTLHWDTKLTSMLTNVKQVEERLMVVVGDSTQLKLLGVPAYKKGTNEAWSNPCSVDMCTIA